MPPVIHHGKGVFIFPPISVHDVNESGDLDKPVGFKQRTVKFTHTKSPSPIKTIVTEDGFIAPIMQGTDDEILEFLNVIIATALSKGHQAHYVTRDDFCSFSWEDGSDVLSISSSHVFSLRNQLEFERDREETFSLWKQMPREKIEMHSMSSVWLDQGHSFYNDTKLRDYVILLGEAWGLSYDRIDTASFLYAWMIIENFLETYWYDYVDSLSVSDTEKDIIKNNVQQTSYNFTEILQKLGHLDSVTKGTLTSLRKIRNGIVHEKKKASKDDALNCMHVVNEMIYKVFNNDPNPFSGITLIR